MIYSAKHNLETAQQIITTIQQIAAQFDRLKENVGKYDVISRLPLALGHFTCGSPFLCASPDRQGTYSSENHTYYDITTALIGSEIQTVSAAISGIYRYDRKIPFDQVANYALQDIIFQIGRHSQPFEFSFADGSDEGKTSLSQYPCLIPELDFQDNWTPEKLVRALDIVIFSKAAHIMLMLADPERPYLTETLHNALTIETMCKDHIATNSEEESKNKPALGLYEIEVSTYFDCDTVIVNIDNLVVIDKEWVDSGNDLTISDDSHKPHEYGMPTPDDKILAYKSAVGEYVPIVIPDPFEPKTEFEKKLKERLTDDHNMFSVSGQRFLKEFTKFTDKLIELREAKKKADEAEMAGWDQEDDDQPYCVECTEDDPRNLICLGNYPNGTHYQCRTCSHKFMY